MVPVSDDVLMHWKYIKRVKKNGKWKYYYDWDQVKKDVGNKLGVDERERLKQASKKQITNTFRYAAAKSNLDGFYEGKKEHADSPYITSTYYNRDVERKRALDVVITRDNMEKANKEYDKAVKEYVNTPMGKIEKTVTDAANKGTNFLTSIAKKIDTAADKAGVDERQRAKEAAGKVFEKRKIKDEASADYHKKWDEYENNQDPNSDSAYKRVADDSWKKLDAADKDRYAAELEYWNSLHEYINTPLGKIEDTIYFMHGKEYYERLTKKKKKLISQKSTANE